MPALVLKAIHTQLPSAESLLSWGNMSLELPGRLAMSSLVEMNPKIHVLPSGGEGRRRGFNSWEVRYYFVPVCKNDLLDSIPRNCLPLNDLKQD